MSLLSQAPFIYKNAPNFQGHIEYSCIYQILATVIFLLPKHDNCFHCMKYQKQHKFICCTCLNIEEWPNFNFDSGTSF